MAPHDWHRGLRRKVNRFHVNRENAVEFLLGYVEQRLIEVGRAGIVHDDVEAAEFFDASLDGLLPIACIRDVGGQRDRMGAQVLCNRLDALAIDIGEHEPRTFARKHFRDARAETARRTGDKGGLSLQTHHGLSFVDASLGTCG